MKDNTKIILIILTLIIGFVVIDTLFAIIFKYSPILSWKKELVDSDSWVDKGVLIDTYYCTREQDIVTVNWKLKTSKYTCPIE